MIINSNILKPTFLFKWVFCFFILFSAACKTDLSKVKPPEDINKLPQLSITKLTANYKISSRLRAKAYAPVMNKYTINENYVEFPKGVDVKFYDENYYPSTTLVCNYAINYPEEKLWKFSGDVEIVSQKGGTLRTQELYFNQANEKIYSVKYVEVTDTSGTVIRGKGGFESNYDFTVYEFKNVDGVLTIPEEEIEE